jgi:dihydroorotase
MGSSTGNMLVDNIKTLEGIFSECPVLIATHCEDEQTIRRNTALWVNKYGENMPAHHHPEIRSEEACYRSSSLAVQLAGKHNSRLHILHLSTARELELFEPVAWHPGKRITAEVCVHHLWFNDTDYDRLGTHIKWNPAIKTRHDQEQLLRGLLENRLDVVATDHAPHTLTEKGNSYLNTPSGGPMVQHSLMAMLELWHRKQISLPVIIDKMCHAPAMLFGIAGRGFIREGYHADLVLVDTDSPWTVNNKNIWYKCGWSPMEGLTFRSKVLLTMVNGNIVYENPEGDPSQAVIHKEHTGMRMEFSSR